MGEHIFKRRRKDNSSKAKVYKVYVIQIDVCLKLKKLTLEEKDIIIEVDVLKRITLEAQPEIREYIRSKIQEIKTKTSCGILIENYV